MKTLILTKNNLVSSQFNNEFRIEFQPPLKVKEKTKLAFVNTQLYYSFFNIDSELYNNHKIGYTWIDGTEVEITIPDGSYEIDDLYTFLQIEMIARKHYVLTEDNLYRYYNKFSVNASYYRIDIIFYPIETLAEATENSYSLPEGATWSFPESHADISSAFMRLNFPDTYDTNKLFGITDTGVYPNDTTFAEKTVAMTTTSLDSFRCYSDTEPQVTPFNNIVIHCDKVANDLSSNGTQIYSFAPAVSFAQQMDIEANILIQLDMTEGSHQFLTVRFTDEFGNNLRFQDKSVNIQLAILND